MTRTQPTDETPRWKRLKEGEYRAETKHHILRVMRLPWGGEVSAWRWEVSSRPQADVPSCFCRGDALSMDTAVGAAENEWRSQMGYEMTKCVTKKRRRHGKEEDTQA